MRLALVLALALGCAADPALAPRDCTPGTSSPCACPGGAAGAQTCTAEGRVGACVCADAGESSDAVEAVDAPATDAPVCVPGTRTTCTCPSGSPRAIECSAAGTYPTCPCATGVDASGPSDASSGADVVEFDACARTAWRDEDGDGYGTGAPARVACSAQGYAAREGDCNDRDSTINPGASERCDGIDSDCDGRADDDLAQVTRQDHPLSVWCAEQAARIGIRLASGQPRVCTSSRLQPALATSIGETPRCYGPRETSGWACWRDREVACRD